MSKPNNRDLSNRKETGGVPSGSKDDHWEALRRLAETLGNVSEACRRAGVSRHVYYEWKRTAGEHSNQGARESIRLRSRHPHSIPEALERDVVQLALDNPEWGCDRISYYLKLHRKKVSSPTVQKILIRNRIGKKSQRLEPKDRHP